MPRAPAVRAAPGASGLYGHPSEFFDVTSGQNLSPCGSSVCEAGPGYDGPTGWGTPDGPFGA